jgi:FkbM family methyltransferase
LKAAARAALLRLGYRIEGVRYTPRRLLEPSSQRVLEFDDVVCRHMFEHGSDCTFVQVGAYDGVSTDPLRKYIARCGWKGVMLEPQPGPASELRALYDGVEGVVILQAAVDGERRPRSLYALDRDGLPKWAGGMASFDRDHLLRHDHLIPGLARSIRELTVNCVTFADVLDQLASPRLDLLQIDAEGADGDLISLFPFDRVQPAIVHWESKNMPLPAQERTLDLLCGRGYRVARSGAADMLAVRDRNTAERVP